MADPMTALSIAATTVQFVDFSLKILSFCKEIQNSTKNATEVNTEIESSVEKLQQYQKRLKPITPGQGVSQKDVDTIENARQECNETAGKILKVLQDLKPRKKRRFGDIAWAAWRTHRADGKIQSLEKKLEGRNTRFREALTDTTRERILHMLTDQEDLMRNKLLPEVKQMHTENEAAHTTTHGKLDEARVTADQKDFLRKLSFPGMSQRHETIEPPTTGTYEWIFTDTISSPDVSSPQRELRGKFMRWLVSDEKVFWISGKAGSGKSSLMAFIESHKKITEGLTQWAQGRPLTVLNFFFWRAGVELQKSIPGLLRSLLLQLFNKKPSAIDEVCSNDSALRYSDWTENRLTRILNEVLDIYQRADECIFFLIDGLDEYEGDYSELLDVIIPAELRLNVKICLSSRPLETLEQRLNRYASVRLEDLNFVDIKEFVSRKLEAINYPYGEHMKQIPRRAEGLFLWAALVTKELIHCYHDDHAEATLQKVLDDLPQGLKPLFDSLFSRVDKRSHDFLLLLFQLLKMQGRHDVDIALVTACLHHKDELSLPGFFKHCEEVQRLITLRSKGLLQVVSTWYQPKFLNGWALEDPASHRPRRAALTDDVIRSWATSASPTVGWLHRSAYDYIFSSSEVDRPTWIREINIAQDLLAAASWLFRNGLLIYTTEYNSDYLESGAPAIMAFILSQADQTSDGIYQILDNLCKILESSLSEGSWLDLDIQAHLGYTKEASCSLIAEIPMTFWGTMVRLDFYDYVISRLESVKRGRFAHSVCYGILLIVTARWRSTATPHLMGLLLDILMEQAGSSAKIAGSHAQEVREYRCSSKMSDMHISWLTRLEIAESSMMENLERSTRFAFPQVQPAFILNSRYESSKQDLSGDIRARLLSAFVTLTDNCELFAQPELHDFTTMSSLEVHFSVSHALKCIDNDVRTNIVIPMRFLGNKKRQHRNNLQDRTVGIVPLCVFHTSAATNFALSRFLVSWSPTGPKATQTNFKGPLVAFLRCRETVVSEIQEDAANQLDARQQRCLLILVQICFFKHWTIEDMKDVRSISADSQSTQ